METAMARSEITGRKPAGSSKEPTTEAPAAVEKAAPIPRGAFSILEFAIAHGISEAFVFKMISEGWGPQTMRVGGRTLISVEAAAQWRLEREAAAREEAEAKAKARAEDQEAVGNGAKGRRKAIEPPARPVSGRARLAPPIPAG
jgi:hypothetical protein